MPPASVSLLLVASRSPRFAFFGLIYLYVAAAYVFSVERLYGRVGVGIIHFHKAESAGSAGFAVADQGGRLYRSEFFE